MSDYREAIRPSSAHRWLACSASPRAEAMHPSTTSRYAEEGTAAHMLAEAMLKHPTVHINQWLDAEFNGFRVSKAMIDYVYEGYVAHVLDLPGELHIEMALDLSDVLPKRGGTSDAVVFDWENKTAHVCDLKYGQGVEVYACDNEQLMLYALGVRRVADLLGEIDTFVLSIFQPRRRHIDHWEVSYKDLELFEKEVVYAVEAIERGDTEFVPGEHCQFCAHAKSCVALADFVTKSVTGEFEVVDIEADEPLVVREPDALSLSDVSVLLRHLKTIKNWCTAIEARAIEVLAKGDELPGWKLVAGRSNRKFVSDEAWIAYAKKKRLPVDAYAPRQALTVAQVEKQQGPEFVKNMPEGLVLKPPGKPTLALASDPRPAVQGADAFETVEVETDE